MKLGQRYLSTFPPNFFFTFCSTYYLTSPPKQNRREMASLCFIHPPKLDLHRLGHPSCCFYQYE